MKFTDTLNTIVAQDLKLGIIPALIGDPGIGKSAFCDNLATVHNTKTFTLACNQLAVKEDLTGARLMPYTKADGTEDYKQMFFPHELITEAINYAVEHPNEEPILFLDELNRTTSDVTSALLTMCTARRLGQTKLPDNLRTIIAGNDKGNVTSLDEASVSRFAIYRVEPDANTLIEILGDALNPWVKAALIADHTLVFERPAGAVMVEGNDDDDEEANQMTLADLYDGDELTQITTPRTIENLSKWLNLASMQQLTEMLSTQITRGDGTEVSLLQEAIEAKVGATRLAVAVMGHIAQAIANGSGGNAAAMPQITAPRPANYDNFSQATSVTDVENAVAAMNDEQKVATLVYAIHDGADNSRTLPVLAASITMVPQEQIRLMIQLITANQANNENVKALLESNTPLAASLAPTLGLFANA